MAEKQSTTKATSTSATPSTPATNGSTSLLKVTTAEGFAFGIKSDDGEFVNGKMRYKVKGPYLRVLRQGAKGAEGATPFGQEEWLQFLSSQGEVNPMQAMLDLSVAQWNTNSRNDTARKLEDAYNATHVDPSKVAAKAEKTFGDAEALSKTAAGKAAQDEYLRKTIGEEAYALYIRNRDGQASQGK